MVSFTPTRISLAIALALAVPGFAQAQTTTLPAVKVTGSRDDDGVTEGTGSYTTRSSSTATKLNLSPRETPQTLTVITRQKMDDFALTDINKVLESTSTVTAQQHSGSGITAELRSRGFDLQSQYDGIPDPIGIGGRGRAPSPDTAFLDKVEILQGASGLMSGAGEPGGTINMVRKRPTENFQTGIEAGLGSWGKKRLVGDVSGPLIHSGKIRGRAVGLIDNRDSFTDYVYQNKQGFYGIVEADVTPTTTVNTSVMYQKDTSRIHTGIPMAPNGADLGLPRSAFYGIADGNGDMQATTYTLNLEQKLPQDWSLKAAYTHTSAGIEVLTPDLEKALDTVSGNGLTQEGSVQRQASSSNVFDLYASGPFQLFGRKHELVVGASSAKFTNSFANFEDTTPTAINIYNYDVMSIPRPSKDAISYTATDKTAQRGIYAATRLNLTDSLKVILGTRASWYQHIDFDEKQDMKENAVISPYAGLIFDITNSTSIYASYSDIFKPQTRMKFGGGTIDPVVGKNYEMGVKSEFQEGRLSTSAAVFRLEQTNLPEVDKSVPKDACNGRSCYKAAGLVVSQGIDLGLNGELSSGWQVGAGYTLVNSTYANGAKKGNPYNSELPKQIFRVYTTYEIPGTNWIVGGNVRAQSRMYNEGEEEGTEFRIEQGAYTVVGLMAKYRINKHAQVSLTVDNLFDRRYYDTIGVYDSPYRNQYYGAPRNFAANLRYIF